MKSICIRLLVIMSTTLSATPMIYVHDDNVKAKNSIFVPIEESNFRIDSTYLPQHVINVQREAKPLPTHAHSFLSKAYYLKLLLPTSSSELIIQKEQPQADLINHINEGERDASIKNALVRLYRKIEGTDRWRPIASIPEQHAQAVITDAVINSDGTIDL